MPFTRDRDLLALEPTLFRDIAWAGQRLLSATGSTSETTLTLAGADAAVAGVTRGHVALIDGLPVEVLSRDSASQLTVSLLRASDADAPIPPPALSGKPVTITTFAPQIAVVHAQLLRAIGIDADDGDGESRIVNADHLRHTETLGALHLIYSAAASLAGPASAHAARAELYERRFRSARARTPAKLDLDGDGEGEVIRSFNHYRLLRA